MEGKNQQSPGSRQSKLRLLPKKKEAEERGRALEEESRGALLPLTLSSRAPALRASCEIISRGGRTRELNAYTEKSRKEPGKTSRERVYVHDSV